MIPASRQECDLENHQVGNLEEGAHYLHGNAVSE